jgi:hypothetical protein
MESKLHRFIMGHGSSSASSRPFVDGRFWAWFIVFSLKNLSGDKVGVVFEKQLIAAADDFCRI